MYHYIKIEIYVNQRIDSTINNEASNLNSITIFQLHAL